jgi:hypothetical protein
MSIAAFLRGADLALWERLSKPRFVLTGPLAVQVARRGPADSSPTAAVGPCLYSGPELRYAPDLLNFNEAISPALGKVSPKDRG